MFVCFKYLFLSSGFKTGNGNRKGKWNEKWKT
jgi:hypothetical protein